MAFMDPFLDTLASILNVPSGENSAAATPVVQRPDMGADQPQTQMNAYPVAGADEPMLPPQMPPVSPGPLPPQVDEARLPGNGLNKREMMEGGPGTTGPQQPAPIEPVVPPRRISVGNSGIELANNMPQPNPRRVQASPFVGDLKAASNGFGSHNAAVYASGMGNPPPPVPGNLSAGNDNPFGLKLPFELNQYSLPQRQPAAPTPAPFNREPTVPPAPGAPVGAPGPNTVDAAPIGPQSVPPNASVDIHGVQQPIGPEMATTGIPVARPGTNRARGGRGGPSVAAVADPATTGMLGREDWRDALADIMSAVSAGARADNPLSSIADGYLAGYTSRTARKKAKDALKIEARERRRKARMQTLKAGADYEKTKASTAKTNAEVAKLKAETEKVRRSLNSIVGMSMADRLAAQRILNAATRNFLGEGNSINEIRKSQEDMTALKQYLDSIKGGLNMAPKDKNGTPTHGEGSREQPVFVTSEDVYEALPKGYVFFSEDDPTPRIK